MSHSLEVRVPFLDRDVLRVALSISDSAKVSESIAGKDAYLNSYRELGTKKVLVDIGKQYLPRDYDLQPKRGFRIPYEHWLKEYLEEEVSEAFGEDTIRKRGFFNYSETSAIFNQYKSGNFGWPQIWLVVVFEFWCREYIDD
jgi:asparagine synthase (glutamine-hydrolysing)